MEKIRAHIQNHDAAEIIRKTVEWHRDRLELAKKLVCVDRHTDVSVRCADGEEVILTDQQKVGFRCGASAVLDLFKDFPLKINEGDDHGH